MRTRFRVLGLFLGAAFAFGVLVVASAQAKKVEEGPLALETRGGAAHLVTEHATFSASSSEGRDEITSATGGIATIVFNGVEIEGLGFKCNSAGEPSGVVKTFPLAEETGWINEANMEAGVLFKPALGTKFAEFNCAGFPTLTVIVTRSVIGQITPLNIESTDNTLNLIPNGSGKANSPESFEGGGPSATLVSEFSSAPGIEKESLLQWENVDVHNRGICKVKVKKGVTRERCKSGRAEISTIVNPAQPEFGRCVKMKKTGHFLDANCSTAAEPGKGKFEFVPVPG
jgi:hypothetical protein